MKALLDAEAAINAIGGDLAGKITRGSKTDVYRSAKRLSDNYKKFMVIIEPLLGIYIVPTLWRSLYLGIDF